MRETKTTNFRIEDAITEAYDQMNESFGKDRFKKLPGKVVAKRMMSIKSMKPYAKQIAKMKLVSTIDLERELPYDKVSVIDIDKVMEAHESHCGTDRKDEAKFDKLRKKLKYINPETLQDVLDGKIKLNPAEKKEFDMFMRDARKMFGASKEEVNEQLSAKFSKDFDKEAKEKGPHQDSSVYKQMRDIIKSKGMGTVKTDKGSLKVDMQSAYRWLASYHMLNDKNKKNLVKMAQRGKDSLATTIRVAQTLTVKR